MVIPAGGRPHFTSSVFAAVHRTETVATICSRKNFTGKLFNDNQLANVHSLVTIYIYIKTNGYCSVIMYVNRYI
jgi:hypothetical protein